MVEAAPLSVLNSLLKQKLPAPINDPNSRLCRCFNVEHATYLELLPLQNFEAAGSDFELLLLIHLQQVAQAGGHEVQPLGLLHVRRGASHQLAVQRQAGLDPKEIDDAVNAVPVRVVGHRVEAAKTTTPSAPSPATPSGAPVWQHAVCCLLTCILCPVSRCWRRAA